MLPGKRHAIRNGGVTIKKTTRLHMENAREQLRGANEGGSDKEARSIAHAFFFPAVSRIY
jgi:hypothetical protein